MAQSGNVVLYMVHLKREIDIFNAGEDQEHDLVEDENSFFVLENLFIF